MKKLFLQGAVDLELFMIFILVLFNKTDKTVDVFSISWLINTVFLVGIALFFIYDVADLGNKIENYIKHKE